MPYNGEATPPDPEIVPPPAVPYTAAEARNLVHFINVKKNLGVKYWSIGNEPNAYDNRTWIASQIADDFKDFARAMKNADPTIAITGPDLSFYDAPEPGSGGSVLIMDLLTDCPSDPDGHPLFNEPSGEHDITGSFLIDNEKYYHVDVLNFHTYPFPHSNGTEQTRQEVIDQPSNGFQENLDSLKERVDQCNKYHGRIGASSLKMAVTEINVDYENPAGLDATEKVEGVGAQSFLAGQYWADVMSVGMKNGLAFMTFWSAIEGDDDDGRFDLGYIASSGTLRSTYFHFQMLARNFRGNYAPGTTTVTNVKAFGAKDTDQIAVMILNQTETELATCTLRLDNVPINPGSALDINIDAGVAREHTCNEPIAGQSTVLLLFDAERQSA